MNPIGRARRLALRVVVGLPAVLVPTAAQAQDPLEDPEALVPGLIAVYAARSEGSKPLAIRIDPDLSLDWGTGAPDARVPSDGFQGRWTGILQIQAPGTYRFFARTDGDLTLSVAGQNALDGQGGKIQTKGVELTDGLATINVEYRHNQGQARLAIDWEGPNFRREPLPARFLTHTPPEDAATPRPDLFETGRRQADRLGCANCHAVLDLPKHPQLGPDLSDAGRAIDPDWLNAWLVDPGSVRPNPRMPGHGLSPTEAADLAAFLAQGSRDRPLKDEVKMALNVADPGEGRTLFRTAGCLGCHTKGKTVEPPADRAAPDLTDLGRKRSTTWLASFLARPSPKAVGRHRPDMHLNADAAAHLAAYLVTEPPPPLPQRPSSKGDAKRGRSLVESHRCASCHAIPGVKAQPADVPLGAESDPLRGCLADGDPGPKSPRYRLTADQRAALREFVAALPAHPSPTPDQVRASDTMRRLNCLGCHSRDGAGGVWIGSQLAAYLAQDSDLGAWKGTLTPPNLTAVGDKLRPEALALAVRGQGPAARPWLSVHMPTYPFEAGEADAIVEYLRGHDRMASEPDPPPATRAPDSKTIEAAAALIGQRGFGCISCHVLAGKIPPGGEPETLGPDLSFAHQRMTERYFRRWIADPQRIIPGTSMPQFLMPAPNNPGTLDEQLATIWDLLGSDRVAEVASVGTRELLKRQGDRAMVVRDMVILPDAPGKFTPRGLAIGLKNDQGLLFDTDRLAWVGWWSGGFLSRTKSGRLWEWHPEGPPLWTTTRRDAPIVFKDARGAVHAPGEVRDRFGSFSGLTFEGDGLSISYRLHGPDESLVNVQERLTPTEHGWTRLVRVDGVPKGYRPLVAERLGERVASSDDGRALHWTAGPSTVALESPSTGRRDPGDPASYQWPMTPDGDGVYSSTFTLKVTPAP